MTQAQFAKLEAEKQAYAAQVSAAEVQKAKEAQAMHKKIEQMHQLQMVALGMSDADRRSPPAISRASRGKPGRVGAAGGASRVSRHVRSAPMLTPAHTYGRDAADAPPNDNAIGQRSMRHRTAPHMTPSAAEVRGRQWLYWQTLKAKMDSASTTGRSTVATAQSRSIKTTVATAAKQPASPRTLVIDAHHTAGLEGYPSGLSASQATTYKVKAAPPQADWLPIRSASKESG